MLPALLGKEQRGHEFLYRRFPRSEMDQHSERQILGFLGGFGPSGRKLLIHF
jgi:hypothetical protein